MTDDPQANLRNAGASWRRSKDRESERMAALYEAIAAFCAVPGGTEAEAARIAGVDRMTVRRALGKL